MAITRTFTADEWEALGLPSECDGGEVLTDRIVRHSRWSVIHEVTFRVAGQATNEAYRAHYSAPATESQDEPPPSAYRATLVRAVERLLTVYEPVQ